MNAAKKRYNKIDDFKLKMICSGFQSLENDIAC